MREATRDRPTEMQRLELQSTELLCAYLKTLCRLTGADSASWFVPAGSVGGSAPILVHDGERPAVPEMADVAAAQTFCGLLQKRVGEDGPGGEARTWFETPSPGCFVTRLSMDPAFEELPATPGSPRRRRADATAGPAAWLGLRFADGYRDDPFAARTAGARDQWEHWLLALGKALVYHTCRIADILHDPVSLLPGRAEFQSSLHQAMEQVQRHGGSVALVLINPDDFDVVNERFDREAGDAAIREIARRLRAGVRQTDLPSRYGGAVFGLGLPAASIDEAKRVAEKLRSSLTETPYLDGAVRLVFSFGVAAYDASSEKDAEEGVLELIRRGDRALNAAKLAGGGRIVAWRQGLELEEVGHLDRLNGIFTADLAKDYRNMLLLWDTVSIVAGSAELGRLADRVAERICATFKPSRVGLFDRDDGGELRLLAGLARQPEQTRSMARVDELPLAPEARGLPEQACRQAGAVTVRFVTGGSRRAAYAVPLMAGERCLGCLYLEGGEEALHLDSSDLIFLKALAGQLAVALDRARLTEQENLRREQERRRLKSELKELRQAFQQAKLVYRSPQLETLLGTVRRAASTDATVLIAGESGTGKELIARTLHELSPRRDKPLVVVDCGAIAASLIDSELFGHAKGAFTGAQERSPGRLVEADGGTLLLDEIGELPLEVQSKLLRFVQEKQLTPVGSSRPRTIDVRVVAVTNRDLAAEVAAGRFRQDLYYRLKVLHLVVPPLRERPDDILCLAQHFLEKFSVQYQKGARRFDAAAEEALVRHGWPGNVRELQNRVLQGVILCESEQLGRSELGFPVEGEPAQGPSVGDPGWERRAGGAEGRPLVTVPAVGGPAEAQAAASERLSPDRAWGELQAALGRQVDAALERGIAGSMPLGKWLIEDLVLEAHAAAGEVLSQGARLLGIPETTFGRRVRKVAARAEAGLLFRSISWQEVRRAIARLVRAGNPTEESYVERARRALLEEIFAHLPADVKLGSALMGVTEPTFRRWLAKITQPT